MSNEEKLVSHYQLKTLLRKDGFGAVYLAGDTRDGKEYVLRLIELDPPTLARITGRVRARAQRDHPLIEGIRQRMKRISELKHAHILPVIEFGEEHIQANNAIIFYMVSPYEKESLLSYWSEHYSSVELLSLEVIADLIFQAAEALFAVHKRGLVHQYVRLSSFMLHSSAHSRKRLQVLLTDFWFADITTAILEEGEIAQALSVYLAPEQLTGNALAASDQYALALLAYELLLGHRLSQVERGFGLYERAVRQRSTEISETDLEVARRLDLVLSRALAEQSSARFHNIEEFAYTLRAVVRGEAIDLADEDTFKLPIVSGEHKQGEAIVAAAAGALVAGEISEELVEASPASDSTTEMLAASEVDEAARAEHHHSLHKTVLTSEGMEAVALAATGTVLEETTLLTRETISSTSAQGGAIVEEEQTLAAIEGEQTQLSAGAVASAGFAAGVIAGEALQQEADISAEQTQISEGESAGFMAGLAAGEALQQEADISAEQTQIRESSAAAFAAGLAAGEAMAFEQEADIATEQTQVTAGGGALATGAAALAASELLAGGIASDAVTPIVGGASTGVLLVGGMETGEVTQVAAAGVGASMVGAGMGVLESTQVAGAGAGMAAGGFVAGGAAGRRRRWRRPLLVAIILAVLLALIGGSIFAFAGSQSTATVTLTLESHTIQNSYLVTAVTGSTSQGQVQASMLTQTVSQSKSGGASGFFQGSHATGFITFHNTSTGCGCPIIIPAGTAFTSASGVTVVTDTVASVASLCTVTVRAHAVIFGPGGDIPTGDIHAAFNPLVSASNPFAFGGGQPSQSNVLVQQSDIDGLASSLQAQVVQSAQTGLQSQVKSNERLAGTPACQPQTTSDHAAGDFASSITVTVSATCTAEAYDYSGAVQIVQREIQSQTATYFSSQFVLVGAMKTTVTSATLVDAKAGTLLLAIETAGKWGYQFRNNLKQSLAKVIAGKDVSEVRALLASQSGVSAVNIAVSSNGSKLPSDDSKITIVLKN